MRTATLTELNQQTRRVLDRVARGEEVCITDRGRVVAKLVATQENPLAPLLASGMLRPATCDFPLPRWRGTAREAVAVAAEHESGALLREMRG